MSRIPPFQTSDHLGRRVESADLVGHWTVLYFYPRDGSFGCTREACGFRDRFADLRTEGVLVYGVSRDSAESHQRFVREHGLPFPLLLDPQGRLAKAFGARGVLGMNRRITVILDPSGQVVKRYRVRRWRRHANDVLGDIKTLKLSHEGQEPTKTEGL